MFNVGPLELLVILIVALVVVGPEKLPELARTVGRAVRELRKIQDDLRDSIRFDVEDQPPPAEHQVRPIYDETYQANTQELPAAGTSSDPDESEKQVDEPATRDVGDTQPIPSDPRSDEPVSSTDDARTREGESG